MSKRHLISGAGKTKSSNTINLLRKSKVLLVCLVVGIMMFGSTGNLSYAGISGYQLIEAEAGEPQVVLEETGMEPIETAGYFEYDFGDSLYLPDPGDMVHFIFQVPHDGIFFIRVRVRAGLGGDYHIGDYYWNEIYDHRYSAFLDGEDVSFMFHEAQVIPNDAGYDMDSLSPLPNPEDPQDGDGGWVYWGIMKSQELYIERPDSGEPHVFTIFCEGEGACIDYAEIIDSERLPAYATTRPEFNCRRFEAEDNFERIDGDLIDPADSYGVYPVPFYFVDSGQSVEMPMIDDGLWLYFEIEEPGLKRLKLRQRCGTYNPEMEHDDFYKTRVEYWTGRLYRYGLYSADSAVIDDSIEFETDFTSVSPIGDDPPVAGQEGEFLWGTSLCDRYFENPGYYKLKVSFDGSTSSRVQAAVDYIDVCDMPQETSQRRVLFGDDFTSADYCNTGMKLWNNKAVPPPLVWKSEGEAAFVNDDRLCLESTGPYSDSLIYRDFNLENYSVKFRTAVGSGYAAALFGYFRENNSGYALILKKRQTPQSGYDLLMLRCNLSNYIMVLPPQEIQYPAEGRQNVEMHFYDNASGVPCVTVYVNGIQEVDEFPISVYPKGSFGFAAWAEGSIPCLGAGPVEAYYDDVVVQVGLPPDSEKVITYMILYGLDTPVFWWYSSMWSVSTDFEGHRQVCPDFQRKLLAVPPEVRSYHPVLATPSFDGSEIYVAIVYPRRSWAFHWLTRLNPVSEEVELVMSPVIPGIAPPPIDGIFSNATHSTDINGNIFSMTELYQVEPTPSLVRMQPFAYEGLYCGCARRSPGEQKNLEFEQLIDDSVGFHMGADPMISPDGCRIVFPSRMNRGNPTSKDTFVQDIYLAYFDQRKEDNYKIHFDSPPPTPPPTPSAPQPGSLPPYLASPLETRPQWPHFKNNFSGYCVELQAWESSSTAFWADDHGARLDEWVSLPVFSDFSYGDWERFVPNHGDGPRDIWYVNLKNGKATRVQVDKFMNEGYMNDYFDTYKDGFKPHKLDDVNALKYIAMQQTVADPDDPHTLISNASVYIYGDQMGLYTTPVPTPQQNDDGSLYPPPLITPTPNFSVTQKYISNNFNNLLLIKGNNMKFVTRTELGDDAGKNAVSGPLWAFNPSFWYKPKDDVRGFWTFNEAEGDIAADRSDFDNHGNICGPIWLQHNMGFLGGNALFFDGIDDYVSIPHDSSLNLFQTLNIECIIKMNRAASNRRQSIISKKNTFDLFIDNENYLCLGLWNGQSWSVARSDFVFNAYQDNRWTPIKVTWNNSGDNPGMIDFFVNCRYKGSDYFLSPLSLNDQDIWIGGYQDDWTYFHGIIDEILIGSCHNDAFPEPVPAVSLPGIALLTALFSLLLLLKMKNSSKKFD